MSYDLIWRLYKKHVTLLNPNTSSFSLDFFSNLTRRQGSSPLCSYKLVQPVLLSCLLLSVVKFFEIDKVFPIREKEFPYNWTFNETIILYVF